MFPNYPQDKLSKLLTGSAPLEFHLISILTSKKHRTISIKIQRDGSVKTHVFFINLLYKLNKFIALQVPSATSVVKSYKLHFPTTKKQKTQFDKMKTTNINKVSMKQN